ncbi:complement component C6-like [Styela clava]
MHQHNGQRCPSLEQTNLCFVKPCPVICRWGTWGEWSSCDKCGGGLRSRYRKVAFPSLYGGQRCEGSDAGIDYNCTITGNCSMLTQQCSKSQPLRCDSDSHCIASWLKCNGDADCEDTSDERNCTTARNPCGGVVYKSIPNIGNIGAGYDILKAESMGHVLDNNKYGGTCDTVYLGEFQKRFRKPYNIQSYRSSAEVHTTLRVSSYRNTMELNEKKNKDYEYKISAEISFAYDDIVTYGAKAAKSEETVWKKIIESSIETDYKYFILTSRVRIGQFNINRKGLKLSSQFRQRIGELPIEYDYAKYMDLIRDFGTHYYSSGVVGGVFKVVFQYAKSLISRTKLTDEEQKSCITTEAAVTIYGIKPSLSTKNCAGSGSSSSSERTFLHSASKTTSSVVGGSSKAAAVLTLLGEDTDHGKYQQWVDSIKHNPAIIDFKLAPISDLVPSGHIRKNTERALSELFDRYDPNRCSLGFCRNGGKFVILDQGRKCVCLCPSNYFGVACMKKV